MPELDLLSSRISNLERIVVALIKWTDFTWKQFHQEISKLGRKTTKCRGGKKGQKCEETFTPQWVVPPGVDLEPPPSSPGKRTLPTKHFPTRPRVDTVTSLRGKPMISMNGFFFHCIANGDISKRRIWTCDQRTKTKCPVRLHSTSEVSDLRLIVEMGVHNHPPDPAAGRVRKIMNPDRSPHDNFAHSSQSSGQLQIQQSPDGGGGSALLQSSTTTFNSSVMYYPIMQS
ncbi:uncharacterized protein LOC110863613 isoform X2 [Folsomia candida]|uniref:uncharacterized protein LOC110863613 isoform X2 n=1 Tax=Folsomia candida TaxID=158441 RepID=UPI000B8FD429|nr:uncharacterized protein LOC110863613 isoform X2 [Folsomia candida]